MAGKIIPLKKLRTLRLIRMTPNESRSDSEGQVKLHDISVTNAEKFLDGARARKSTHSLIRIKT
jgi:hypothetical protein